MPSFSYQRRFVTAGIAALFSVASTASRARVFEGSGSQDILDWVLNVERLSAGLRDGLVSPVEWQDELLELTQRIPLSEILKLINFEELAEKTSFAEYGVATSPVRLPTIDGVSRSVYTKFFAVRDRRAVIPHGHLGMASGHLVLQGSFHLRQYDRISIEDGYWTVQQTIDRIESSGAISSISDERDNVHWLIAEGNAYTLDFIMAPAYSNSDWTVQNLDMDAAQSTQDGKLHVPTIRVQDAVKKYGRT